MISGYKCFLLPDQDVLLSSFLQLFTSGPDQDVSCELDKGIVA